MEALEVFKTLIEEPDKQSKRLFSTFRMCLNVILTTSIYKHFVGS